MDKRDLVERLLSDAQGEDLGANGMGWSPDPALLREAADELKRLQTENAALKREAHTWSKAAETYAASEANLADALTELVALEDMRLRLRELHEMGHGTDYDNYHKRLPLAWDAARAALGPNDRAEPDPKARGNT